ncbi:MAG TPA: hypothetical protein VI113_03295 [Alphaproteobacteria bacterium]
MKIGDELAAVGNLPAKGAAKDAVLSALHGKPGERRVLTVEHENVRHEIYAVVLGLD